jgi:hypothetical protein
MAVVDRVRQERHRARQHHDRDLDERRDHEGDEGHLDRPDASLVALQGGIDGVRRVVAVRSEHLQQRAPETTAMFVFVVVRMGVVVSAVSMAVIVVLRVAGVPVLGHAVRLSRRWCAPPATA